MSTSDRLARLLFIVPYVAHRDGVPLAELAAKLDVKPSQLEADLELLAMVGRPPLTPDHLIDLYVEDDVVYVDLDQRLSRPPQLTHEEARALVVGAKLVGDQGGLSAELNSLLDRIVAHLNPFDRELVQSLHRRVGLWREGEGAQAPVDTLRQAIDSRQEVDAKYYSISHLKIKSYRLQPLGLITHSGVEYCVARDIEDEGTEKLFRQERFQSVTLLESVFEAPARLETTRYRKHDLEMSVRAASIATVWFAPEVADVVRERFSKNDVRANEDGSVEVQIPVSSPEFLARWVLPFGTDAMVLEPAACRQYLESVCREALAVYDGDQPEDSP